MGTRPASLVEAQKRYRQKNKDKLMEYKRLWYERKGKTAMNLKYSPIEKRQARYYPVKMDLLAHAWLRQLFKDV